MFFPLDNNDKVIIARVIENNFHLSKGDTGDWSWAVEMLLWKIIKKKFWEKMLAKKETWLQFSLLENEKRDKKID